MYLEAHPPQNFSSLLEVRWRIQSLRVSSLNVLQAAGMSTFTSFEGISGRFYLPSSFRLMLAVVTVGSKSPKSVM